MKPTDKIMELADQWMFMRLHPSQTWSDVEIARNRLKAAIEELAILKNQEPVAWLFPMATPVGQRLQISYTPRVNPESFPVYRAPVNCKYPTCHSVDYQQALATDVADQIFGKELPDWSAA